jgi:hypothetical protein
MAVNERDLKNFVEGLLVGFFLGVVVTSILILTFI